MCRDIRSRIQNFPAYYSLSRKILEKSLIKQLFGTHRKLALRKTKEK
jgi:hypothetical protein